jgi:hypothetical protein
MLADALDVTGDDIVAMVVLTTLRGEEPVLEVCQR